MNAIKKETTPAEFAEQLQQAATGEHDQLCRDGIPNETLATEAIEYIIDGMPVQEKAEWLQAFTEAIPGRSPAGLTFGSVIADFRGTLKELRKKLRTKDFELKNNENLSPLDKVELVLKARDKPGVSNFNEAITLVERETGTRPFINDKSFYSVRYRWQKHLQKKH